MKNLIVVLLGSNIDKERNLPQAVGYLASWCKVLRKSRVYETCPVGLEDQPTFFNAALLIDSPLDAFQFRRDILSRIELNLDRVRTSDKNAPRTIDADLMLFNEDVFDLDSEHHIPDPELLKHLHVIVPVADVVPDLPHPETGELLSAIANRLNEEITFRGGDLLTTRDDIAI